MITTTDSYIIYIRELYFITTTTTTVGYGDFAAYREPVAGSTNMILVMTYMFTTILVFAYLRETVFNMKSNLKIKQVIDKAIEEAALFMNQLDNVIYEYFKLQLK